MKRPIRDAIPATLIPWLNASGSLTARFEAMAKQPLQVQPVFEGFNMLDMVTNQELSLPRPQVSWIREVNLYGSSTLPWAQARSVFPISALQGSARRLRHLGCTPLGYVLFGRHKPKCRRVITTSVIDGEILYTRKNFYHWHGHEILVQETFLPAFVLALEHQGNTSKN